MPHKAGFVNIIGNPNVGKSTIMNALTGENLSAITSRAQTTRHRILGIVNGEDFQIVYSDTPGIIKPGYRLQEYMVKFSRSALVDGDIILYVTDVKEKPLKNQEFIERLKKIKVPVFLIINKIDLGDEKTVSSLISAWSEILPRAVALSGRVITQGGLAIAGALIRIWCSGSGCATSDVVDETLSGADGSFTVRVPAP